MLLYEYKVRDAFTQVRDLAETLREQFDYTDDAAALLPGHVVLKAAAEILFHTLPSEASQTKEAKALGRLRQAQEDSEAVAFIQDTIRQLPVIIIANFVPAPPHQDELAQCEHQRRAALVVAGGRSQLTNLR